MDLSSITNSMEFLRSVNLGVFQNRRFLTDRLIYEYPRGQPLTDYEVQFKIRDLLLDESSLCYLAPENFERKSFDHSMFMTKDGRVGIIIDPSSLLKHHEIYFMLSLGILWLIDLIDIDLLVYHYHRITYYRGVQIKFERDVRKYFFIKVTL